MKSIGFLGENSVLNTYNYTSKNYFFKWLLKFFVLAKVTHDTFYYTVGTQ